jgi:hypothetical protein
MGCLAISLTMYFTYCRIQKKTDDQYPLDGSVFMAKVKVMRLAPSIGYSLLIIPINMLYKKLATFLTDYGKKKLKFLIDK